MFELAVAGAVHLKLTCDLAVLDTCVHPLAHCSMLRVLVVSSAVVATLVLVKLVGLPTNRAAMNPSKIGVVAPVAGAILNVYVAPGIQPLVGLYAAPVLSASDRDVGTPTQTRPCSFHTINSFVTSKGTRELNLNAPSMKTEYVAAVL